MEAISLSAAKSLVIVGAPSPDAAAITEPDQAPSHLPGTSMCTLLKRTVQLQKESTPLQQKIREVSRCDARERRLSSLTAAWGGQTVIIQRERRQNVRIKSSRLGAALAVYCAKVDSQNVISPHGFTGIEGKTVSFIFLFILAATVNSSENKCVPYR